MVARRLRAPLGVTTKKKNPKVMCQFNLVILDKETVSENLEELFIENGFGYRELNNNSLQAQIGNSKQIILTTKGHCDCGPILGINDQVSNRGIDITKEKKKLRKKKWSESKIERYLSDKLKEQNKKREESELGNEAEETNWVNLSRVLRNQMSKFGILYQQFSGLIEDEEFEIEQINQISMTLLNAGEMRNFKEDQLNWITK